MKKVLFIIMSCVLCLGLVGGAFAYFSDTETSSGNTFTAGTIDLALNGANPFPGTAILTLADVKPSQTLAPLTLTLENVGQNEGKLTIKFTITGESDKPEDTSADFEFSAFNNATNEMSADEFASLIYVQAATEDGTDLLPKLLLGYDTNSDGKVSLYELAATDLVWSSATSPYSNYLQPTGGAGISDTTLVVTLHLGDSLDTPGTAGSDILTGVSDNRPQADGIIVSVTATLTQVGAP